MLQETPPCFWHSSESLTNSTIFSVWNTPIRCHGGIAQCHLVQRRVGSGGQCPQDERTPFLEGVRNDVYLEYT